MKSSVSNSLKSLLTEQQINGMPRAIVFYGDVSNLISYQPAIFSNFFLCLPLRRRRLLVAIAVAVAADGSTVANRLTHRQQATATHA